MFPLCCIEDLSNVLFLHSCRICDQYYLHSHHPRQQRGAHKCIDSDMDIHQSHFTLRQNPIPAADMLVSGKSVRFMPPATEVGSLHRLCLIPVCSNVS